MNFIKDHIYGLVTVLLLVVMLVIGNIAMADTKIDATKIYFDSPTKTLYINGQSHMGQVSMVAPFLTPNKETGEIVAKRVVMTGPGGDMKAGLLLGRMISRAGVDVVIPEGYRCVSACAFAALGSDNVTINGELWFHRFYNVAIPMLMTPMEYMERTQSTTVSVVQYLTDQNMSMTFMQHVFNFTSYCKFLVITDAADLKKYRHDGTTEDFLRRRTVINGETTFMTDKCSK